MADVARNILPHVLLDRHSARELRPRFARLTLAKGTIVREFRGRCVGVPVARRLALGTGSVGAHAAVKCVGVSRARPLRLGGQ